MDEKTKLTQYDLENSRVMFSRNLGGEYGGLATVLVGGKSCLAVSSRFVQC